MLVTPVQLHGERWYWPKHILSFFTLSVHCSGGNRQQNSVQFDNDAVDPSLMTVADKDSDE